jgi:hypothetical protein
MTAQETVEYAQISVDQAQRGLNFVQDKIDRVDDVMLIADDIAVTAGNLVAGTRRWSRRGLIIGGILVIGVIVIVVASRCRQSGDGAGEIDEPTDEVEETTESAE